MTKFGKSLQSSLTITRIKDNLDNHTYHPWQKPLQGQTEYLGNSEYHPETITKIKDYLDNHTVPSRNHYKDKNSRQSYSTIQKPLQGQGKYLGNNTVPSRNHYKDKKLKTIIQYHPETFARTGKYLDNHTVPSRNHYKDKNSRQPYKTFARIKDSAIIQYNPETFARIKDSSDYTVQSRNLCKDKRLNTIIQYNPETFARIKDSSDYTVQSRNICKDKRLNTIIQYNPETFARIKDSRQSYNTLTRLERLSTQFYSTIQKPLQGSREYLGNKTVLRYLENVTRIENIYRVTIQNSFQKLNLMMSHQKSESLHFYKYLCQKIGSEKEVTARRLAFICSDLQASNKLYLNISSGSKGEGLDLKGSDIDMMHILSLLKVFESDKDIKPVMDYCLMTLVMNIEDTQSCFTHLQLYSNYNTVPNEFKQALLKHRGMNVLSSDLYKSYFLSLCTTNLHPNFKINGPCITDSEDAIEKQKLISLLKTYPNPLVSFVSFPIYSSILPMELRSDFFEPLITVNYIPFAYFLLFLCYYHLEDTKACQWHNGIYPMLRTILAMDNNYQNGLSEKRVCMQDFILLGIANQMFGNSISAKDWFRVAASMDPYKLTSAAFRLQQIS
ncbi:unnamed protein product [Mytilus edulis]|uniref:Uncharacterized protein n=1 Tax=Mytilus edulis TaxID=6550 RepID=A0A8S3V8F9_MYTED|nr:unnamed protein product [Mytilus edulis]